MDDKLLCTSETSGARNSDTATGTALQAAESRGQTSAPVATSTGLSKRWQRKSRGCSKVAMAHVKRLRKVTGPSKANDVRSVRGNAGGGGRGVVNTVQRSKVAAVMQMRDTINTQQEDGGVMTDEELDAWEVSLKAQQQTIELWEAYLAVYGPYTA